MLFDVGWGFWFLTLTRTTPTLSHLQTQFVHQEQRLVPATDSSYSGDLMMTEKYLCTSRYAFHIGRVYAISAYVGGVWAVRLFSRSFLKLDVSFHSFTPLINCNILKLTPGPSTLLELGSRLSSFKLAACQQEDLNTEDNLQNDSTNVSKTLNGKMAVPHRVENSFCVK